MAECEAAIPIPAGTDHKRGPVGLQNIGPRGADATVIAFARRVPQLFAPILAGDSKGASAKD
jgi:Asp-tRNA(Asn)/Glu-tRNA(Gln) amidotransferase A subunit family amidase